MFVHHGDAGVEAHLLQLDGDAGLAVVPNLDGLHDGLDALGLDVQLVASWRDLP